MSDRGLVRGGQGGEWEARVSETEARVGRGGRVRERGRPGGGRAGDP